MLKQENDPSPRVFPKVTLTKDVVVVGAGTAGICAAVAAARNGRKTALVTDRPVLGGSASSEVRVTPSGADTPHWNRYARETGIMEELTLMVLSKAQQSGKWRWLHYDDAAFELCYAEPNLEVFLNTTVYTARKDGPSRIASVEGVQLRSETVFVFEAGTFIDCSGDGVVGYLGGADYRVGREAKGEFDELFAPEKADRGTMGATLLFSSADRGHPVPYKAPPWAVDARELSTVMNPDHAVARQLYRFPDGTYYGFWWAEFGGEVDSIHDDGKVMRRCRELVYGLWDYVKNSGRFKDVENQEIDWIGYLPGKRESRRLMGDTICTSRDFLAQRRFDDRIGHTGWPIDIHPPLGYRDPLPACTHEHTPGITDIPFRSLYSRNIDNLLFAGRNVSVSHEGLGTLRVIATTAVMGQAAGTAAALCQKEKITPRTLAGKRMADFQRLLLAQDQSITGERLLEPGDLSRGATASASSERALELLDGKEWHNLEEPLGLILPIDSPMVDGVSLYFKPLESRDVEVSIFSVDRAENYRLQNLLAKRTISVSREGWVDLPVDAPVGAGKKIIVAVGAAKNVLVRCAPGLMTGALGVTFKKEAKFSWETWFNPAENIPCFKVSPRQSVYAPSNVNNGFIRPYGVPNAWASAAMVPGKTEWIELRFPREAPVGRVELVFNSNLNIRRAYFHRVFPEIAKAYEVALVTKDGLTVVAREDGNIQRFRRHSFDPAKALGVRLSIHATWGHPHAELFDLRVYA